MKKTSDLRPQTSDKRRLSTGIITTSILLLIACTLLLVLTACDRRTTGLYEDGIVITEFRTTFGGTNLYKGYPLHIEAHVKDENGNPASGIPVIFKPINVAQNIDILFTSEEIDILEIEDGVAVPVIYTNTVNGIATAIVYINNNHSNPVYQNPLTIGAYAGENAHKTITLSIEPDIEYIDGCLTMFIPQLVPNGIENDVSGDNVFPIEATLRDIHGNMVPDGIEITFISSSELGIFSYNAGTDTEPNYITNARRINVPTKNGRAMVTWNSGPTGGVTTLFAMKNDIISTNRYDIRVNAAPGMPRYITFDEHPSECSVGDAPIILTGEVRDAHFNRVAGAIIAFRSYKVLENGDTEPLGSILPTEQSTDSQGNFNVRFTPGISAGTAQISAVFGTGDSARAVTSIRIISSVVHSIRFNHNTAISLNVQGTGGTEVINVGVSLLDSNDDKVTEGAELVKFRIIDAPLGVRINGHAQGSDVYANGDTVLSSAGEAYVTISSGHRPGIVRLVAEVVGSEPLISAVSENIIIHAGPPVTAIVSFPEPTDNASTTDEFNAVGTASWEMQVGAKINDLWGNPVANGLGVTFSIESFYGQVWDHILYDDWPTLNDPNDEYIVEVTDSLAIHPFAQVGNENASGDSIPGFAFTKMYYHGRLSNRTVKIKVVASGIVEYAVKRLPMVAATLSDNVRYSYEDVLYRPTPEWSDPPMITLPIASPAVKHLYTDLEVIVQDGLGNPMWNAPLSFTSSNGQIGGARFYYRNPVNPAGMPTVWANCTIPFIGEGILEDAEGRTDGDGYLYKRAYKRIDYLFWDPMSQYTTYTIECTAWMFGYPGSGASQSVDFDLIILTY